MIKYMTASVPKGRKRIPEAILKGKVVTVYELTKAEWNKAKQHPGGETRETYTRVGDARVMRRKKNGLSYRSGGRQETYWDVTLEWVITNAGTIAALEGLKGLPNDIKKEIMGDKRKTELQKAYGGTIEVERVKNSRGLMKGSGRKVIITGKSEVKELKRVSEYKGY